MFAQVKEKSLFRVGQLVRSDYYPKVVFKVVSKEYDLNGSLVIALKDTADGKLFGGFRQKNINSLKG